jgi:hypothetical protein
MRPDIDEQLTGIARILERVVAPAVGDPYAADVLAGVTAVLDGIATGWADVAGFLAWDARETLALVAECAPALDTLDDASLTDVVAEARALAAAPPLPLDTRALAVHHTKARALLARVAPVLPEGEPRARVTAHMRARVDRYPVRAQARMPGQR